VPKAIQLAPKYIDLISTLEKRPVICTPINANNEKDYLKNLTRAIEWNSDLAELRLDFLSEINDESIYKIISKSKLPLIVTNRNKENGGRFSAGEELRLSLLSSAVMAKPAFVDIELSTDGKDRSHIINLAKENKVGIICSYHDFNKTPTPKEIYEIFRKISETTADLAKLVFTPQSGRDFRIILEANDSLRYEDTAYTLFGMGKKGQNTRLMSLLLGSCLAYCSLDNTQNGLYQISVEQMRSFFERIEKHGWRPIREKRQDILTLTMAESNDDNGHPLTVIEKLTS